MDLMPRPTRLRRLHALVVPLTLALLPLAGCSSGKPSTHATTVAVDAGRPASLRMPGGARVDIPANGVSGAGRLAGSVVDHPPAAPPGMVLDGQVFDFELQDATLTGPV